MKQSEIKGKAQLPSIALHFIEATLAWSATGAIVVSTPFAMAEFLPPQVWQAISILLKGTK